MLWDLAQQALLHHGQEQLVGDIQARVAAGCIDDLCFSFGSLNIHRWGLSSGAIIYNYAKCNIASYWFRNQFCACGCRQHRLLQSDRHKIAFRLLLYL